MCSFLFSVCLPVIALAQQTIRVNAGGPAYRDSKGQSWSADYGFNTGSLSHSAPSATVTGTSDPILFKSARVGVATTPDLQYRFAVGNGLYKVNLYFAETYYRKAGSRVFDVQMQGATVFSGVDIFAQAGADHALVKSAQISVTGGQIAIRFAHRANANVPIITAIEILPSGTATAPSIIAQPTSQRTALGQTATFKVAAAGTAPLVYQWLKNGTVISGATSATYTTLPTTSGENGEAFHVVIKNSAGSMTSNSAILTVSTGVTPVQITTGSLPDGQVGVSYSASLAASGGTKPYDWSILSGSLPSGLTLDASGAISGTPTSQGTSSLSIQVQDSSSPAQTAFQVYSPSISASGTGPSVGCGATNGGATQYNQSTCGNVAPFPVAAGGTAASACGSIGAGTYHLTQNIGSTATATCITFSGGPVVFDFAGFTITGRIVSPAITLSGSHIQQCCRGWSNVLRSFFNGPGLHLPARSRKHHHCCF